MPKPTRYRKILGKSVVEDFFEPIFTIGDQTYSRWDLTNQFACCATPRAARILSKALEKLVVTTASEARRVTVEDLARLRGVGPVALYVYLCWCEKVAKVSLQQKYDAEKTRTFGTLQRQARKPPKPAQART